jgi:hypothetical protein
MSDLKIKVGDKLTFHHPEYSGWMNRNFCIKEIQGIYYHIWCIKNKKLAAIWDLDSIKYLRPIVIHSEIRKAPSWL